MICNPVMSYPGGYPYHEGGYSSMPSTPRASYSWELEQNPNQPGNFQQPEQSQQQQAQPPPPQPELYESNPPSNPPIQTIQLEERVPIVPSQRREDYELERVQTHSRALPPQRLEGRLAEGRGGEFKPHIHVDTSRPGSSSGPASAGSTSGSVRVSPTARGQAQFHPYRRPHGDASRSRRDTELHVRFAGQGQPQGSMSAPSAAPSRITSLGSTIGSMSSPLAGTGRTITPQPDSLRRFIIRADVHYDADSKLLTVQLELPGLKKRDLSITLSTCVYNRVRQVVIAGRSKPMLPEIGYAIKERKFGEFSRTFAVPPETKSEDVSAEMQDGLLVLKISMGPPADSEDSQEIAIR